MPATAQPLFATGGSLPAGQSLPMIGRQDNSGNYATSVEQWVMNPSGLFIPLPVLRQSQFTTSTPLAANGTLTEVIDGQNFDRTRGRLSSDQNGTLVINLSDDNQNWDQVKTVSLTGGQPYFFDELFYLRYMQFVYTNGATAQTTFRFSAYALMR